MQQAMNRLRFHTSFIAEKFSRRGMHIKSLTRERIELWGNPVKMGGFVICLGAFLGVICENGVEYLFGEATVWFFFCWRSTALMIRCVKMASVLIRYFWQPTSITPPNRLFREYKLQSNALHGDGLLWWMWRQLNRAALSLEQGIKSLLVTFALIPANRPNELNCRKITCSVWL